MAKQMTLSSFPVIAMSNTFLHPILSHEKFHIGPSNVYITRNNGVFLFFKFVFFVGLIVAVIHINTCPRMSECQIMRTAPYAILN